MFERLHQSWTLANASWKVLQANKGFFMFPCISMLIITLITLIFIAPIYHFDIFNRIADKGGVLTGIVSMFLFFVYSVVIYTVALYFQTALVCATLVHMRGGVPTWHDAFRIANDRLDSLFKYAIFATIIRFFLRWLEDRGALGEAASMTLGFSWSVATFLFVPVLVVENVHPVDAIARSAELLKKTWGEQIIGNIGIGLIFTLMTLVILAISIPAFFYLIPIHPFFAWILAATSIFVIVVLQIINSTLGGIFVAAVHEYAADDNETSYFDKQQIMQAFKKDENDTQSDQ